MPRHPRRWPPAFRWPRRSLRMRLTLLYGALFLAVGIAVLTVDNLLGHSDVRPVGGTPPGIAVTDAQQGSDSGQLYSGVALALLAVLSLALGWLVSGRIVRPLRTMTAITRTISAGRLYERLDIADTDDEFEELATTLDDLLGRLETSFESQRHFVANASHELRTPVAAGRALLQVALANPHATAESLRATCEQLLTVSHQQERLIEALLTMADSERGIDRWEPFDLAELAGDIVQDRRREAERRGVRVRTTLTPAPTTGDRSLVASLITNLVDNALRHNVAGGWVEISTTNTAGRTMISACNTGALIPPDEINRLLQPFQRLDGQRIRTTDGHGLGLAIVHAIAIAHHATLTARARPDGGLHVTVAFPGADERAG